MKLLVGRDGQEVPMRWTHGISVPDRIPSDAMTEGSVR